MQKTPPAGCRNNPAVLRYLPVRWGSSNRNPAFPPEDTVLLFHPPVCLTVSGNMPYNKHLTPPAQGIHPAPPGPPHRSCILHNPWQALSMSGHFPAYRKQVSPASRQVLLPLHRQGPPICSHSQRGLSAGFPESRSALPPLFPASVR